jgi:hypothetical protein
LNVPKFVERWDSIPPFTLNEAEKRWREIEEGKVETVSVEEALRKARKSITK